MITPPTTTFPFPSIAMHPKKIIVLMEYLRKQGETYGLGSKITPLSSFVDPDGKVDCSGFVRWAIWHATDEIADALTIPDGSVNQHDWVKEKGFKHSDYAAGMLKDGAIRIAFMTPADGGGIGHVTLIIDGFTYESHGGTGPDSRKWGSQSWMKKCKVYVLTPPT